MVGMEIAQQIHFRVEVVFLREMSFFLVSDVGSEIQGMY